MFRKNALEQKAKVKLKSCSVRQWMIMRKKKFVAKAENLTVGQLLDVWAEEELKTGTLSNGTVENYLGTIRNIKKHPLAERKLKNVTSEHLQSFFGFAFLRGSSSRRKREKGLQQRLYPFFFRSHAAVLPFCSISKAVYYVQSHAVY